MKRLMSGALITALQANKNCLVVDLFQLVLPTGTTVYLTSGQFDVTVPSGTTGWSGSTQTFKSMQYGHWERGAITLEAGFDCKSNTMELSCVPQAGTAYPGMSVGLLAAAHNGLFDAATVTLMTAYFPMGQYGTLLGSSIETKFYGTITKVTDINRTKVIFECADSLYLLDMKVPSRLFQSTCPWGFCDSNCSLTAATYTQTFTAKSGSTSWVLTPVSAFTQTAGYFTQGVVTCLTGANAGLSQSVKLHDGSGNLNVMNAFLLPITAGDTFSVIAGCSKTLSACKTRKTAAGASVDNSSHFGGTPYVPPPNTAV